MSKFHIKNYIVIFFIFLSIAVYETPFFIINAPQLINVIKLLTPFIFVLLLINIKYGTAKIVRITRKESILFFLYMLLFGYLIIPSVLSNDPSIAMLYWIKYVLRFLYFFLFIIVIRSLKLSQIIFVFIWLGVVLGIQSILLFFQIITGHSPAYQLRVGFDANDLFRDYGIWGYANWIVVKKEFSMTALRAQSFFSEATRFAIFQTLPFFASVGVYNLTKRKVYLITSFILLGSIILTFSITAFVAFIVSGFAYIFYRKKRILIVQMLILTGLATVVILSVGHLVGFLGNLYQSSQYSPTLITTVLGKPEGSITLRTGWLANVFSAISDRPLGLGFWDADFVSQYGKLPMAPVQWLLSGGFIGLLIIGIIMLYIYQHFLVKELSKPNSITMYIALALIVQILIGINHSNWFDLIFFLTLAIFLCAQADQTEIR